MKMKKSTVLKLSSDLAFLVMLILMAQQMSGWLHLAAIFAALLSVLLVDASHTIKNKEV